MGNITEYCKGCTKIGDGDICTVYSDPPFQMRWAAMDHSLNMVGCSFNYKNIVGLEKDKSKLRIGQQKQKKKTKKK